MCVCIYVYIGFRLARGSRECARVQADFGAGGEDQSEAKHISNVRRSTGHTHTHTHTSTENNTPDTDTHAHDKNNTPNPQTNIISKGLTLTQTNIIPNVNIWGWEGIPSALTLDQLRPFPSFYLCPVLVSALKSNDDQSEAKHISL